MSVLLPSDSGGSSGAGMGTINSATPAFIPNPQTGVAGANLQASTWGSVIPISAGFRRVDTVVLWAGAEQKVNVKSSSIAVPPTNPTVFITTTVWDVTKPFAVSLGERLNPGDAPPQIRRVWADGILVWSDGAGIPVNWNNVTEGYTISGQWVDGAYIPANNGGDEPPFAPSLDGSVPPGIKVKSTINFRFYNGSETQVADPEILAAMGNLAPAYRGLMYMVIDGLIFGTGSTDTTTAVDTDGNKTNNVAGQGVTNNYPVIQVEIVDANATTVSKFQFKMEDDFPGFPFANQDLMANWVDRTIAAVGAANPSSPQPSAVSLFDMDTATQLSWAPIADGGTNVVGGNSSMNVWDVINNVIYACRSNNPLCSIGLDGTLIDTTAITTGADLGPANVDSTTITVAKPAIVFQHPHQGDIDYILVAGEVWPCLLAGHSDVAAWMPETNGGMLKDFLNPKEFYNSATGVQVIKAFKLFDQAIISKHLSYQDAAFLVAYNDTVELVFVTASLVSGKRTSNILGRQLVYTSAFSGGVVSALLDKDGNILVQDTDTAGSGHTTFVKIKVTVAETADFALAPGFRGLFPKTGATLYSVVSTIAQTLWTSADVSNSDLGGGTFLSQGLVLDTVTGAQASVTAFSGTDSPSSIWDSVNGIRFYWGSFDTSQVFQRKGMHFAQIQGGLSGTINAVGDMVRDIAEFVGYTSGDLDVDSRLTDQVVGVLIVKQFDLTSLFNDIGALYDFAYVNSGGKLSFRSNANNPVAASGRWMISGALSDGETATIGSSVYTFKHTPTAPFDVKIGVNDSTLTTNGKEKTAANFLGAIMADLTLCAADARDAGSAPGFFAGTVANLDANAVTDTSTTNAFGVLALLIKAIVAGSAGNTIATTSTGGGHAFSHTTLLNGVAPPPPSVTLSIDDLAAVSENQLTQQDAIVTTIMPPNLGQQAAAVDYFALEQNYKFSMQTFIPDDKGGTIAATGATTVLYDLPFIMSTSEAYNRVAKTAIALADNEIIQNFRLSQEFMLLEPSDIVAINMPPFAYILRLDECTFNGDWSTSYSAISYTFRNDIPVAASDVSSTTQNVPSGSDCLPVVMDAPLIDPKFGSIPGNIDLFAGVRGLTFGFGQASLNEGVLSGGALVAPMQSLLVTSKDAKWATLALPMPDAVEPFYRTVEDSITLVSKTIKATDLASATYQQLVAGLNCIAVGQPGNWEYIYFRDVELSGERTIKLTGLIRAQRGTDAAVVHAEGDYVLLLASVAPTFVAGALQPESTPVANVGATNRYLSAGIPTTKAGSSLDITVAGLPLYPFSPCHLGATLVGGNDLDLVWTRRDRLNTEFVEIATAMSEASELYDLEILSGSSVVRTVLALGTPAYPYTSAQQTTDGFTPGSVATLKFRVYQKGELGRGFPRLETVNVN